MTPWRTPACLCALALAVAALAPAPLAAADGDLDPTFDGDGRLYFGSPPPNPSPGALVSAPDGSLVIVGSESATARGYMWRRLDGLGLGSACIFEPAGFSYSFGVAGAFDGAGRLVVAGYGYKSSSGDDVMGVVRFDYPSCALDTSFGDGGYTEIPLLFTAQARAVFVATVRLSTFLVVERIFVVGHFEESFNSEALIVRLKSNGDLDADFGSGGIELLDRGGHQTVRAAQRRGSRIVVVGLDVSAAGEEDVFLAAVRTSDGALDPAFGGDGWVDVDLGSSEDESMEDAYDVAIAGDGTLYVPLIAHANFATTYHALAFTWSGAPETVFGGDGEITLPTPPDTLLVASNAIVQSDGKLLLAGSAGQGGTSGKAVLRLLPNGAADGTYGGGDAFAFFQLDPFPSQTGEYIGLSDMALWSGRPVLTGVAQIPGENKTFVARLASSLIFADGFEGAWAWE